MKSQRRLVTSAAVCAVSAAAAVSMTAPSGAATVAPDAQLATAAPRWTALFDRNAGWTGADGIYTAPLSGDERPGSTGPSDRTYFTFSDTFVGKVGPNGNRLPGSTLVNNTTAILEGGRPRPSKMHFFVNREADGDPTAVVVPDTSAEHWFWPGDAIAIDDTLYEFSLRMKPGGSGEFAFAVDGISLLRTDATTAPPFGTYDQVDTPLFVPETGAAKETTFGQALMPNTVDAGAPHPDGYLYVYGTRAEAMKKLVAARVRPASIEDFDAYEYWNGAAWVGSPAAAASLTSGLSMEFSVTPLADGRYVLVYQRGFAPDIAVRYGDSPVGPWSASTVIYTAPEADLTPNTWVYNAKAHPSLSTPGSLLISYNVNTFDFGEHFENSDIYRPRFIKLPL